jgi:hypothetical protein
MLIFQPLADFCPHENIQPRFVVKLWDMIINKLKNKKKTFFEFRLLQF